MSDLSVRSLEGSNFGAMISGVDPNDITADDKAQIRDTYRKCHGLICFSFDQLLKSNEELHQLTAIFGKNEFAPGRINGFGKKAVEGENEISIQEQVAAIRARGDDPFMAYIGNVDPITEATRPVDTKFFGEWEWHTDMSYIKVPPTFSLLHARQVPDEGGDTGFCNMVMAAAQLPQSLRKRVMNLRLKHDSTYSSSGVLRPGMSPPASPVEAQGHYHPIIRKVPSTGEEALFLGRRTNGYIEDLALEESEALLDELWAHATQSQFCYRHHWQVGQVVIWDNRMMMHMRYPMDESKARFMWRTQTRGEAVIASSAPSICE